MGYFKRLLQKRNSVVNKLPLLFTTAQKNCAKRWTADKNRAAIPAHIAAAFRADLVKLAYLAG
jgi:hypothetical protein